VADVHVDVETGLDLEPASPTVAPAGAAARLFQLPRWLLISGLPLGVVLLVVALVALPDAGAWERVGVSALGLVGVVIGLDATLKAIFGPRFDTAFWLAVAWMTLVTLAAVFADLLPLAEARDTSKTLAEIPRLRPDLFSEHPLGTDPQALDMLGGVIYGARISLAVGFIAVTVGTVLGGLLGVVAGYFRGALDGVIGILTDAILAFPALILLLAVVSVLNPTVITLSLALALLTIPVYIRLARANTLAFSQREFVVAARALGARHWRLIYRELLPNVIRPVLSYSFIIVAVIIVAEASLSFLGVGIQRPTPTWGNMIDSGQGELDRNPHLVFVPGAVLFLTVVALNQIGDKARARWDPRQSAI
jgi:peptide/nickel transport system permease protein